MTPLRKRHALAALQALTCLVMAACGGGGGSSSTEAPLATAPAASTPTPAAPAASVPVTPSPPAPVPSPPAVGLSPACSTFYGSSFALVSSRTAAAPAALAKPAKGVAVTEPAFKTCLVRTTDHAADGTAGFARNDYSRRQAFNADSTRQVVAAEDGFWHLYDANTHQRLGVLPGLAGDAEPHWHPTNPNLLYRLPMQGIGMTLHELNVATNSTRVAGDFGARLKARWPTAAAAWTRSEGSPSKDGRYWCFLAAAAGGASLGVFTWDRDTDTITGMRDLGSEQPDHVSMSPSGSHCVVSSDGPMGVTAFTRDFGSSRPLQKNSNHSDIALDANGDDAYVAVDYGTNGGDVFMVNLRTGVRTVLFPTYVSGSTTALHVSGKAFDRPGWVVVSTYAESGTLAWLHGKVMAVQLKADPVVYTLAHHRATRESYWTSPVASVNRDFTRVVFNSNWGVKSETDVDAYVVEIPSGALKP